MTTNWQTKDSIARGIHAAIRADRARARMRECALRWRRGDPFALEQAVGWRNAARHWENCRRDWLRYSV